MFGNDLLQIVCILFGNLTARLINRKTDFFSWIAILFHQLNIRHLHVRNHITSLSSGRMWLQIYRLKLNMHLWRWITGFNWNWVLLHRSLEPTSRREILINGKNFSLLGNLIKNQIVLIENKKEKIYKFKKFNVLKSYIEEHKDLMKKNYRFTCNYKEAIRLEVVDRYYGDKEKYKKLILNKKQRMLTSIVLWEDAMST